MNTFHYIVLGCVTMDNIVLIHLRIDENWRTSSILVGVVILSMASTFNLSHRMPVSPIRNPKYDTCFLKNSHFDTLIFKSATCNASKIASKCDIWSSAVFEKTMMSSK